jgi:subtilisin-like proprotein convertase family protein
MKALQIILPVAALLLASWTTASAATETATYTPNLGIPDNNPNGISDTHTFGSSIYSISDLQLSLNISGGYAGDYYAYLRHGDTTFAVLLNGIGRTATDSLGLAYNGINITLSSSGIGDVHSATPGSGTLTGTWQADGRNIDPLNSVDTTPRTALFDVFNGMDANGDWTLFLADTSPVAIGTLQSWSLSVTGLAVPEPSSLSLLLLGGLSGVWLSHRRKPRRPSTVPR